METQAQLPDVLRRNVLCLLLCDKVHGKIARDLLPIEVWQSDHNIGALVNTVYSYIDAYREVPGEHVFDLIDQLKLKDEFKEGLTGLAEHCLNAYDSINVPYIFSMLDRFHRQTILKDAIRECVGRIDKGEIESVEDILQTALKKKLQIFDAGSSLPAILKQLIQKDDTSRDSINIGIPALHLRGIEPKRKELFVWAAPPKGSKSWAMIHCGVHGIMEGKKVVHISLEMSERVVGERYIQNIGALTKRPGTIPLPPLLDGSNIKWATGAASNGCIQDTSALDWMERKLKNAMYNNLIIKEFPTSSLTMSALRGYLDALEQNEKFTPDLLIVDYADLMKLATSKDGDNRVALGAIYKELRGLAAERNIMVVTASQINRAGAGSKRIDSTHIADDFSKVGTVDNLVIIQSTDELKEVSMAILHIAAARNDESGWDLYISQKLAAGQWCLSSSDRLEPVMIEKINTFVGITAP